MALKWNKEISSGIDAIDLQHQHILQLLNRLVDANQLPVDSEKLVDALLEFNKAIQEHFNFEEGLLAESGYKDLKRHIEGHNEISATLDGITMSVMLDESNIPHEMIDRVVRWFEDHLTSEDTRYFRSVKESLDQDG